MYVCAYTTAINVAKQRFILLNRTIKTRVIHTKHSEIYVLSILMLLLFALSSFSFIFEILVTANFLVNYRHICLFPTE